MHLDGTLPLCLWSPSTTHQEPLPRSETRSVSLASYRRTLHLTRMATALLSSSIRIMMPHKAMGGSRISKSRTRRKDRAPSFWRCVHRCLVARMIWRSGTEHEGSARSSRSTHADRWRDQYVFAPDERRYGLEPHQRGYLQSYQSALTFIVQSSLIRPMERSVG